MTEKMRNARYTANGGINVELWNRARGEYMIYGIPPNGSPTDEALYEAALELNPKPYVAPEVVITSRHVNVARDKKLATGFEFEGNVYQSGIGSLVGIMMAATAAQSLTKAQRSNARWHGGDEPFCWITADNKKIKMDGHKIIALNAAAAAYRADVIMAARAIKDSDKIDADFTI